MGIDTIHTETISVRVTPKIRNILAFQAEKKDWIDEATEAIKKVGTLF